MGVCVGEEWHKKLMITTMNAIDLAVKVISLVEIKKKQKQKQIHLLNLLNANALNFDKAKPPISEYRNAFV